MKSQKFCLALESTCDDTSVSLIKDQTIVKTLSLSSANIQNQYGGVIPEIASRHHSTNFYILINQILDEFNINLSQIKKIYYSSEPGLKGGLIVAYVYASIISKAYNIPIYGINHLYGHIFSAFINTKPEYPFLGVVVSGGNTAIYLVNSVNDIKVLNSTLDDAIGEVYDKVARELKLSYPGGPEIDKLFDINKSSIKFMNKRSVDSTFSYSGLKTAVISYIHNNRNTNIQEIASSFQKTIIDDLIDKIRYCIKKYKIDVLSIGGGVACNSYLRLQIKNIAKRVYLTNHEYCGDNAAMIGYLGELLHGNID